MSITLSKHMKQNLFDSIHEMSLHPELFVKKPGYDFTRKRKLDFETFLKLTLTMEGGSMRKELLDYFKFDSNTATVSAYNQQRSKVIPETFEYLFHEFTNKINNKKLWDGYRLIACDGSVINIAPNPKDETTYFQTTKDSKGFNQLHLNVFYDLCNRTYLDSIIQNRRKLNEFRACVDMIERSKCSDKVILIADRGYENYNIFAHAEVKGWNYVIRVKDKNSNGIISGLNIKEEGSFDRDISLLLTRSQTKEIKNHPEIYKFMPTNQSFDYLTIGGKSTYRMNFRVVRFLIAENSYETIITNLDKDEFAPSRIKELYRLRWGIETSFRELKYAIGMINFHAKKVDYIKQEIYARLTIYNFCEAVTSSIAIEQQKRTKYSYHINATTAIYICKYFLRYGNDISPLNVEMLIQKNLLPIRPGRKDPRKVKPKGSISFLYRVA